MGKLAETDRFLSRNRDENTEVSTETTERLDRWLTTLLEQKGSDLLLIPEAPASIRFEGEVRALESEPLQGAEIEAIVLPALTKYALQRYREDHIGDSSYRIEGVGRFRINLHHERGMAAAA